MKFQKIGIAKELESEENPGGYDQRVILCPTNIRRLVEYGCQVSVHESAGVGIGYSDDDYISAGAVIESHNRFYSNKDLIIKYKGPSQQNIKSITPKSTILCMAHLAAFPRRRLSLEKRQINVLAMESIREWRKPVSALYLGSTEIAKEYISNHNIDLSNYTVIFLGLGDRLIGAFQYIARQLPSELLVIPELSLEKLKIFEKMDKVLVVADSAEKSLETTAKNNLISSGVKLLNIAEKNETAFDQIVDQAYAKYPTPEYGKRKIQCLFETGYCGANYGLNLLNNESDLLKNDPSHKIGVVLGYGNVAIGAITSLIEAKLNIIRVMTRRDLNQKILRPWLKKASIIVSGAEQDSTQRGKNYYITNDNLSRDIKKRTVVIDLIGGMPHNRGPVEALVNTTFLPNIHFIKDDVFVAGLWGWDQAGMVHESAATYSRQTIDILLGEEMLINGLSSLHKGVEPAFIPAP